MDENERITLRLEKENLELIDAFLKAKTGHGNRSQLVREAVQAYIQAIREGGDRITIRVPRYYLDLIDRLVAEGYFLSREHAVVRSVEDWFTRERVKEIQDQGGRGLDRRQGRSHPAMKHVGVADAGRKEPPRQGREKGMGPQQKGWDALLASSERPSGLPRQVDG